MRSIAKLAALGAAGAMVLAACGGGSTDDAAAPADAGDTTTTESTDSAASGDWNVTEAAAPYAGRTINMPFLDRPGYAAAIAMIPDFTAATGINVTYEIIPYESSRQVQVLDFTSGTSTFDGVLADVVWMGEFASNGWMVPLEKFWSDPALADPNLNIGGFFPILLESFGSWDGVVYGLPFDNYSGLMFYNRCMLEEAGFDGPPKTWEELKDVYGPALTKDGKYAFALQSARGETQSADSFMRMVWNGGGSLLDDSFEPNLSSPESQKGLQFRQELMEYMPPSIVADDHSEVVNAFAQGNVAMITEWSAFNGTITDPATSAVVDCVEYAVEPAGFDGKSHPALGGFSLGVNAAADAEQQAATWLFIQWITGEAQAKRYVQEGGVSARMAVYEDPEILDSLGFVEPMVTSWQEFGNPVFRPRFPEWPAMSEIIAITGTDMMQGNVSVEAGAADLDAKIRGILDGAGYYSGSTPQLQ